MTEWASGRNGEGAGELERRLVEACCVDSSKMTMEIYASPLDPEIRTFADFRMSGGVADPTVSIVERRARAKALRQNWRRTIPSIYSETELASPPGADLRGLPSAFLVVASHDPLFDENIAMAGRLGLAGCEVLMKIYPGTVHGFLEADSVVGSRLSRLALEDLGEFVSGKAGRVTR